MQRAIEYIHERHPEAVFYRSEFDGVHDGRNADGYGNKIATGWKVKIGSRHYRVYCVIYSNIGSLYIITKGQRLYLDDCHTKEVSIDARET